MSRWTHVTGCLYIETYEENNNIKEYVENLLKDAPKITGSEADCDIFVNPLGGYSMSTNMDCEHCKYKDAIEYLGEGSFTCDADNNYKCPEGRFQTCVTVTIVGDLRDKNGEDTEKEIIEFMKYIKSLKNGFDIEYYSILISDEYEEKMRLLSGDINREGNDD